MSELVFSRCWNPKQVGSDASEGMDLAVGVRASRQREYVSSFQILYINCKQMVWSKLKVDFPISKDPD